MPTTAPGQSNTKRWVVAALGGMVALFLGTTAIALFVGHAKGRDAVVARTVAAAPPVATTPNAAAVPVSSDNTTSAPASGNYRMTGSTRNVADNGQNQDEARTGSLKVVAEKSGSKLTFTLTAALVLDKSSGDVHTGELEGEVGVHNGEAIYAYDHGEYDKCKITMTFSPNRIELNQEQPCGFGTGVDASGTYVKVVEAPEPPTVAPECAE